MKNTTKLKSILKSYVVSFEMDEDENLLLTLTNKRNGEKESFVHKNYTAVMRQAFAFMNKQTKEPKKRRPLPRGEKLYDGFNYPEND
ncbi:MAG TPA: hypothetical protein VK783_16350 [Bacteroidia bacterium]|jgi:hypothetical protein|nr:hypothetical protein [Bacteroidia bacterium]